MEITGNIVKLFVLDMAKCTVAIADRAIDLPRSTGQFAIVDNQTFEHCGKVWNLFRPLLKSSLLEYNKGCVPYWESDIHSALVKLCCIRDGWNQIDVSICISIFQEHQDIVFPSKEPVNLTSGEILDFRKLILSAIKKEVDMAIKDD